MTVLAQTDDYLVEYERPLLTIARFSDGHCLGFEGKRVAGEFRGCLKTHPAERVIETYIRMVGPQPNWEPLYKPDVMRRHFPLAAKPRLAA